jgi:hypothetical protein
MTQRQQQSMSTGESLLVPEPERQIASGPLNLALDPFRQVLNQFFNLGITYHSLRGSKINYSYSPGCCKMDVADLGVYGSFGRMQWLQRHLL